MENKLIILVPCYNEEAVLYETLDKLSVFLHKLILNNTIDKESKICVINDGSTDKTQEIIDNYIEKDKNIAYIKLTNNFGHQSALMAGLRSISSSVTVSIDADLQDDYNVIEDMIKKYFEGYDIVYGVRSKRSTDTFLKRITAELFYKFMKVIGVKLIHNHADFRLLSKNAVEFIKQFNEKNIFLRGLIPLIGLKSCNVYYERIPRKKGKSKYSIIKMFSLALSGIFGFSVFPINFICFVGILLILTSVAFLFYVVSNFSSVSLLIFLVLFINGLIILSLGIIGEYIYKIYNEVKNRPLYFIEKIENL